MVHVLLPRSSTSGQLTKATSRELPASFAAGHDVSKGGAVSKKDLTKNVFDYHWILRSVAIINSVKFVIIITIKLQKFWPHSFASEITEELRKQKSYRKGWILFCKRFQTCSFMCEKKVFHVNISILVVKMKILILM